jgi:hypothetical protein
MGRKSVAQKIIENLEEEQGEADWIVCYDFRDEQPVGRFYHNLEEVLRTLGGEMIQYSVFRGPERASKAVKGLAEYYGAMVKMFLLDENFV